MRRLAPRSLSTALEAVARDAAPATPLACVQREWRSIAGDRIAGESRPVAERDGVVTIACRSAVWAHELDLMAGELADRVNGVLADGSAGGAGVRLRFVTQSEEPGP